MRYRPASPLLQPRYIAATKAFFPATLLASISGVSLSIAGILIAEIASGLWPITISLDVAMGLVLFVPTIVLMGTIIGGFFTGICIAIFGFPVALLLGERVRSKTGLFLSLFTALIASLAFASYWLPSSSFGGTGHTTATNAMNILTDPVVLLIAAFALPAAYFYRRCLIAAWDEN